MDFSSSSLNNVNNSKIVKKKTYFCTDLIEDSIVTGLGINSEMVVDDRTRVVFKEG